MPTIDQLPPAGPLSAGDELPIAQSGQTYSVTVSQLLGGLQPLITMSPGLLLGRYSVGDGGVELVLPSVGLQLSGGNLTATGADHTTFGLLTDLAQVQELVANSDGHPCRVPLSAFRTLYSAGANIQIDVSGEISVASFLPGSGPPPAGIGVSGDIFLDTASGALWLFGSGSWTLTGGTILDLVTTVAGSGNTAAPVELLPANGGTVAVAMSAGQTLVRVTGVAVAQDAATGDCIVWDVAAAAKRVGTNSAPSLVGEPSISVFAMDPSMAECSLSLAASQNGCVLAGVGLSGHVINWSATLMVATCA
jgi:hypothetical protein